MLLDERLEYSFAFLSKTDEKRFDLTTISKHFPARRSRLKIPISSLFGQFGIFLFPVLSFATAQRHDLFQVVHFRPVIGRVQRHQLGHQKVKVCFPKILTPPSFPSHFPAIFELTKIKTHTHTFLKYKTKIKPFRE